MNTCDSKDISMSDYSNLNNQQNKKARVLNLFYKYLLKILSVFLIIFLSAFVIFVLFVLVLFLLAIAKAFIIEVTIPFIKLLLFEWIPELIDYIFSPWV